MDNQTNNPQTAENDANLVPEQPQSSENVAIENGGSAKDIDSAGMYDSFRPSQIKKWFLYIMIGGLVVSAAISIMAVLFGEFNDFIQKSLFTTLSIVAHSLLALSFVSVNVEHRTKADEVILNTLFGIIIASTATSLLAIWKIITGSIIGDLYLVYLYALIAAVLCRALLQANRVDNVTRMLADASIFITIFLFFLLLPSVFVDTPSTLPDIYYRGIAATAILLGTTSVLTAILHRLYVNKHPEIHSDNTTRTHSFSIVRVIIITVLLFFGVPFIYSIISYTAMRSTINTSESRYDATDNVDSSNETLDDDASLSTLTFDPSVEANVSFDYPKDWTILRDSTSRKSQGNADGSYEEITITSPSNAVSVQLYADHGFIGQAGGCTASAAGTWEKLSDESIGLVSFPDVYYVEQIQPYGDSGEVTLQSYLSRPVDCLGSQIIYNSSKYYYFAASIDVKALDRFENGVEITPKVVVTRDMVDQVLVSEDYQAAKLILLSAKQTD